MGWFRNIMNYNILSLIAPIQPALRAVPGRMIALECLAKCLIAFTMPDGLDWFLEDVAQHALLFIFFGTSMSKRSETARKYVTTRSNIGQSVGTAAPGPGAIPKIAYEALNRRGGACRVESDTAFLTHLFAAPDHFQLFARGATE